MLCGVYFCNGKRPQQSVDAYTKFDATTMRILTVVDGQLAFSDNAPERLEEILVNDYDLYEQVPAICVPANTCYFKANSKTPSRLFVITDPALGIESIHTDKSCNPTAEGVYSLDGTQYRQNNDLQGLPAGLYIVGGKKIAVK